MSQSRLRLLQEERLKRLVRHAYEQVPFYRERFKEAGLQPGDIKQIGDLQSIPVCEREDLSEAEIPRILAKNLDLRKCHQILTSGSCGKPLRVYNSTDEIRVRKMVELRGLLRIGFRPGDRLLILGPEGAARSGFFQRLLLYNTKQISPFLSIESQIDQIRRFRPTILWVYPSLLKALLHALDGSLSSIAWPRIVITSAEQLDSAVQERVEEDLNAEIFNFYASMETGRIATECFSHQGLHINADQLILETLHENSSKGGEVLVTCLNAYAMPFIRYRLGDITAFMDRTCDCGSNFPLIEPPHGRRDTLIQLPSGGRRSFVGIFQILRRFSWISQFRAVQKSPDLFWLFFRTFRRPDPDDINAIRVLVSEYLGERVHLEVFLVEKLPGRNLKFSSFRSESNC
jgi:phenylacetate-CoA ligase